MLWLYITIFAVSCLILIRAGTLAVKSLAVIAKFLKWSEFTVAFLLMSFTTTLPEFFVGVFSGFHHTPQLSFGNVLGSNIIHLTLVTAIAVLLGRTLKAKSIVIQKTAVYTAIIALLPILLLLDKEISRIDGILLLIALFVYVHHLIYHKERFGKTFDYNLKKDWAVFKIFFKYLGFFSLAIILLLLSAEGVVWSSLKIASALGLSLLFIGTMLVALGSNLPEIVFTVKSFKLGHRDMVLGDLLGSVVINSTLVLGTTVLISPLKVIEFAPYVISIGFIVAVIILFVLFIKSNKEITKKEALILLFIYFGFLVIQFLVR